MVKPLIRSHGWDFRGTTKPSWWYHIKRVLFLKFLISLQQMLGSNQKILPYPVLNSSFHDNYRSSDEASRLP